MNSAGHGGSNAKSIPVYFLFQIHEGQKYKKATMLQNNKRVVI